MKFIEVALAAFSAIASAETVALPNAGRRSRARILQQPGRPCAKVKRVANAIAEAIAEPEPEAEADADAKHVWCWLPSEACIKAKRQLEQLNDLLKYMDIRSPTTVS